MKKIACLFCFLILLLIQIVSFAQDKPPQEKKLKEITNKYVKEYGRISYDEKKNMEKIILAGEEKGALALLEAIKGLDKPQLIMADKFWAILGKFEEESITSLVKQGIKDGNPEIRIFTVRLIGFLKLKSLAPELVHLLGDKNLKVSLVTFATLTQLNNTNIIPELIKLVKGDNENATKRAIIVLGNLGQGNKEVKNIIRNKLQKAKSAQIKKECIIALNNLKDQESVPLLIGLLKKNDDLVSFVARALANIGDKAAVKPLKDILPEIKPEAQCDVLGALGRFGDQEAINKLLEIADKNPDKDWRNGAILALGNTHQFGLEKEILARYRKLKPEDPSHIIFMRTLGDIGSEKSFEILYGKTGLLDPWSSKRCMALAKICVRNKKLIPEFLKDFADFEKNVFITSLCLDIWNADKNFRGDFLDILISDLNMPYKENIMETLGALTQENIGKEKEDIAKWQRWREENKDKYLKKKPK